jgi:hypothetical protein
MSLSYYTSYPYPVPQFSNSQSVAGRYLQPTGPYPPITTSGYGNPGGLINGTLAANPATVSDLGNVMLHQVVPNHADAMWQFNNPELTLTPPQGAPYAFYPHTYRQPAQPQKSRLHSSTFGIVAMDASGHAVYSGMGDHVPSYGRYHQ